jgi:hypothetical protein
VGRRPIAVPVRRLLATLAAVLVGAGCSSDPSEGWSTTSSFPEGIRTVAVPIATNDTFFREVEFELTDAIVKEIEARTPYKVTSRARADTVLTVQIRRVEMDQLSKSRFTGLGEEVLIGVTIDFEWRDQNRGTVLVDRTAFTGHELFVPSNPTGERMELGRMAVVQQLARDVVGELRSSW